MIEKNKDSVQNRFTAYLVQIPAHPTTHSAKN